MHAARVCCVKADKRGGVLILGPDEKIGILIYCCRFPQHLVPCTFLPMVVVLVARSFEYRSWGRRWLPMMRRPWWPCVGHLNGAVIWAAKSRLKRLDGDECPARQRSHWCLYSAVRRPLHLCLRSSTYMPLPKAFLPMSAKSGAAVSKSSCGQAAKRFRIGSATR